MKAYKEARRVRFAPLGENQRDQSGAKLVVMGPTQQGELSDVTTAHVSMVVHRWQQASCQLSEQVPMLRIGH